MKMETTVWIYGLGFRVLGFRDWFGVKGLGIWEH